MANRNIHVTRHDLQRLRHVVGSAANLSALNRQHLETLVAELDRAVVVEAGDISPAVIRMHTRVRVRDNRTGQADDYTLVYPWEADVHLNLISVLAPLGTALLGFREGDRIRWPVPGGVRELTVERILGQSGLAPDASRSLSLVSHSSM